MRTFIVGDVHGCLEELDALLERISFVPGRDRLISVGDLVAKGPDSLGVLRRMRELGAVTVRGNHEARVLHFVDNPDAPKRPGSEHQRLATALSPEDLAYLRAMPLWLELPEHDALVVHAGFDPSRPLAENPPDLVMNIRSIAPDGTPSTRVEDGAPWAARYREKTLVLYGHDAIRGLQLRENSVGLDSGCVYGGELTAIELPSRRLHAVRARTMHCVPTARSSLVKLPVCEAEALSERQPILVNIGVNAQGAPEQAIVVADAHGDVHAYRNRCRHLPIPLDAGTERIVLDDGDHLTCVTHGARYRVSDGYCVEGPCAGAWLEPIRVRVEGGSVVLHLVG
ncbi:MAG: Rieske 2Fe-2S domain-containing protein [Myxococcales bacterium]|nr:Rieske 2Fe-2S domain-containing protein [Myxococcales bacterium]